jgi:hypothetical protein
MIPGPGDYGSVSLHLTALLSTDNGGVRSIVHWVILPRDLPRFFPHSKWCAFIVSPVPTLCCPDFCAGFENWSPQ